MATNFNRVNDVMIGDGINSAAAASLTLSTLQKGDLVLVREDNSVVATNAAAQLIPKAEKVRIAMGIGAVGEFLLSSPISGNLVTRFGGVKYRAAAAQVAYIGFNGTTGTIAAASATDYSLLILIKDDQRPHGQKQSRELYNVTTDSSATAQELAVATTALYGTTSGNGSVKAYKGRFVDVNVVSDGTFVASDNILNVVKGSKTALFTTAATYNTGTAYAVGDLIRIGGTGATVPVYQITAISGLVVTLHQPYLGANAAVAAASNGHLATATNFGFKLASQTPTSNAVDQYEIVAFDANFAESAENSLVAPLQAVNATAPDPGQGVWNQVYDKEIAAQGYLGVNSRRNFYDALIINPAALTDSTKNYHSIVIEGDIASRSDFGSTRLNPIAVEIYVPSITAPPGVTEQARATSDQFAHILNGYFSTVLGFTALSFT